MAQMIAWAGILATAAAFMFTMTGCGDSREEREKTHR